MAQHQIKVEANLDATRHKIHIKQQIIYKNNSDASIDTIYLNDWISSYSFSDSPLTKKFLNEFQTNLYIAKNSERGYTNIKSIVDGNFKTLRFERPVSQKDFVRIILNDPLKPGTEISINLSYSLKIQSSRFTNYGVSKKGDYNLNAWYLTPAVWDAGEWKLYSNLNFDNPYVADSNVELQITVPESYNVYSPLKKKQTQTNPIPSQYHYNGKEVRNHGIYITKEIYKTFDTPNYKLITNIGNKKIDIVKERKIIERVSEFLSQNLELTSKTKMLLTKVELKKNDLYGLALLPDFLSPFPMEFKYELAIAKNLIKKQLDRDLRVDPRSDYWLKNGFQLLLFMKYLDLYYPNQKLIGKLADLWGIRAYNFSKLNYNEQYRLTYYQMMRTGRDQALSTPKNKLLSFNERYTSYYKAGMALLYLKSYLNEKDETLWIREFINQKKGGGISTIDFETYLKTKTNKKLDWFFEGFVVKADASDYKIKTVSTKVDSIAVKIKNLRQGAYPITLSTLKDGKLMDSKWINGFKAEKIFSISNTNPDQLVLNYQHQTPEFNIKNNWKSIGTQALNKPLQLRFIRDYQNPNFNQLNIMPLTEFQNVYDGVKLGINFNNRGLLAKPLIYAIAPSYGLRSKSVTGNAKLIYNRFYDSGKLYNTMLGLTLERSSFNYGAFITKFQPFAQFTFRSRNNLRSNSTDRLQLRYINIQKDNSSNPLDDNTIPPYQIFNARFISFDNNIADFKKWYVGLQFSDDFGKINFNYEIRKRTPKDRHYSLRLFAGTFLYNNLNISENNFNYALDRPENYLFEYNYLGQSESSGILSQQLIMAEGAFKSKLEPSTANQWMATLNASASIWRYVQFYGDVGFLKNKEYDAYFAYDSGIRLDLIIDYFELYFPVYSNLGWEINQSNYPKKIRFVFTTDISKLATLFTRKWF